MRTTLDATLTLAPGEHYRQLVTAPGEAHEWRADLAGGTAPDAAALARATPLARIAHLSDLHVMDASSPARAEHCQLLADDPRWRIMLPMHRPNELLVNHALASMVATLAASPVAPVTGGPLDLVLVTGDCVDNAQVNELRTYLAMLDGGVSQLPYDGVQSAGWGLDGFWCPEPGVDDHWKRAYGFPSFAGLLAALDQPLRSEGLGLGWLAVVGNHDWMRQGTAFTSSALEAIAVGDRKSTAMPAAFAPDDALRAYLDEPASYNIGAPTRQVRADADRRIITKAEFISAHIASGNGAHPAIPGHGFTAPTTGDYVHDLPRVRLIVLDTNHPAGHYQGSMGRSQLQWLEERLVEAADRWVVVATHHGLESLTNDTPDPTGTSDERLLAEPVAEVFHRHDNVVAWMCGHRHVHRITPRPHPEGRNGGFWEIVTASIIDWPSQARIVELLELADGRVMLACTLVDHDGDVHPGRDAATSLAGLAGVHREVGANLAALAGPARWATLIGTPGDRNAVMGIR